MLPSSPLFSIIIPTRNRQDLLISAVQSVLNQSYTNYEVIISDNSDNIDDTWKLLNTIIGFQENAKFRYVKPECYMNMADHWEFATQHATGKYVAILTDRFVMRPSALMVLESIIRKYPEQEAPELISWNVRSGYSEATRCQNTSFFSGETSLVSSTEILKNYVQFSAWNSDSMFLNWLPRGLNSIYKRSLAERIIQKHGRLFFPLSPDYTSAFLSLAYSSTLLRLDLPLYMAHGNKSNGQRIATFGTELYTREYLVDPFEGCSIRIDTVINTLIRDYLFIKNTVIDVDLPDINVVGYFLSNYRELLIKERWGSPLNIPEMYVIWHQAVANLATEQQREINDGLVILNKMRPQFIRVRKFVLRYNFEHYYHCIMNFFRRIKYTIKGFPSYENVTEAAKGSDHLISSHFNG